MDDCVWVAINFSENDHRTGSWYRESEKKNHSIFKSNDHVVALPIAYCARVEKSEYPK